MMMSTRHVKRFFGRMRNRVMSALRFGFAIPRLLRYNQYSGFFGRKIFPYIPFLLPHDKSYYAFANFIEKEKDGLFLDIGANDGISALGFRHINKDYRILSIEANLCHEPSLNKIKRKLKRFDYLMKAVGDEAGVLTLNIPLYKGIPVHTASSFYKEHVLSSMGEHFPGHEPFNLQFLQLTVEVITVDSLRLNPDIIKIDTEGFDYKTLRGMAQTIDRCRPYVGVEYHASTWSLIQNFFAQRNYQLYFYHIKRNTFIPLDVGAADAELASGRQVNVFCVPDEKIKRLKVRSA